MKEGPEGWLRSLPTVSPENIPGAAAFLSKVLILTWGGGRAGGAQHFWKCWGKPPWALGKGQGSSQAPLPWQEAEGKGLPRCRGGAKGQVLPDPGHKKPG